MLAGTEQGNGLQVRMSVADFGDGRTVGQHRGEGSSPCQAVVHDRSPHVRQVMRDPAATLDLAGHRGAGTPDRHAHLRHDATPHIVPMYQLDISGRQFAVARLTRELR